MTLITLLDIKITFELDGNTVTVTVPDELPTTGTQGKGFYFSGGQQLHLTLREGKLIIEHTDGLRVIAPETATVVNLNS